MRTRWIDFNSVLRLANLVVVGLLVSAFSATPGNPYMDEETLALGILLCLQTEIALRLERRRRDPFVVLLAFETIFYYAFRIYTLAELQFSDVFDRYPYTPADSNFALLFIIVANLFLYGGLYAVSLKGEQRIDASQWRATTPGSVVVLLLVTVVFAYFGGTYWTADTIPRGLNFLILFLSPSITVLMALPYYLLFRRSLQRSIAVSIGALIVADIVAHTLWGSRSALVAFMQVCLFVVLALTGYFRLKRSTIIIGVALLPVGVALLVGMFAISTFNRTAKESANSFDVSRSIDTAVEAGRRLPVASSLDLVLAPVASRAGFFDYSAEVIAHHEQYAEVLSIGSLGKSIVDNILTPGFDVYDQPKLANALRFVYMDMGKPSKSLVEESYQSDQIGIYGEFYSLFGYASLPLFAFLAAFLKKLYRRVYSSNPFIFAMKRIIVLWFFVKSIESFGIDWTLLEVIPLVVAMYLYARFFAIKRVRETHGEAPPALVPE